MIRSFTSWKDTSRDKEFWIRQLSCEVGGYLKNLGRCIDFRTSSIYNSCTEASTYLVVDDVFCIKNRGKNI